MPCKKQLQQHFKKSVVIYDSCIFEKNSGKSARTSRLQRYQDVFKVVCNSESMNLKKSGEKWSRNMDLKIMNGLNCCLRKSSQMLNFCIRVLI